MFPAKGQSWKKTGVFVLLSLMFLWTACGQKQESTEDIKQPVEVAEQEKETGNTQENSEKENINDVVDEMKEMFGEHCISEQTFEVELSEFAGKVYFVSFAPTEENSDFSMQIIQEDEVLMHINADVPEHLKGEEFESLDAVSFYDINYDNYTDIVVIATYGDTSFVNIYYGFDASAESYERHFFSESQLAENITEQVEEISIAEIRNLLNNGKKNGEFADYREAYEAISRLCQLENSGEIEYNLIYFNEDDIPELVAGVNGYYVSLYTYRDGSVYTLMDRWGYGAMGNAGYEYSERNNSLTNFNADFAGAIGYTSYMEMNDECQLENVVQIVTYNFDDVNENGIPDDNEQGSMGYYSVSYIDGKEVTPEECEVYNKGNYQWIEATMSYEELLAALR